MPSPVRCHSCQRRYSSDMNTMRISLPAALKSFVDEQVTDRGYGSCSAYIRDLIRHDQDRQHLRTLLLEGGESAPAATADAACFEALRAGVRGSTEE